MRMGKTRHFERVELNARLGRMTIDNGFSTSRGPWV